MLQMGVTKPIPPRDIRGIPPSELAKSRGRVCVINAAIRRYVARTILHFVIALSLRPHFLRPCRNPV